MSSSTYAGTASVKRRAPCCQDLPQLKTQTNSATSRLLQELYKLPNLSRRRTGLLSENVMQPNTYPLRKTDVIPQDHHPSPLTFSRSATTIELIGLTSIVFFEVMYEEVDESRSACAFMMRSMLADQPYSPVTSTHGESARRFDTTTLSTLSASTSFISLHRPSDAALAWSRSSEASAQGQCTHQHNDFLRNFVPNCGTHHIRFGVFCRTWTRKTRSGVMRLRSSNHTSR